MATNDKAKTGKYGLPNGVMRIHAMLGWVDSEASEVFQEYGGVKRGHTITRDFLVPTSIKLSDLHIVLQKAFGFQGGHMHSFEIEPMDAIPLVDEKMSGYLSHKGITLFEDNDELGHFMDFFGDPTASINYGLKDAYPNGIPSGAADPLEKEYCVLKKVHPENDDDEVSSQVPIEPSLMPKTLGKDGTVKLAQGKGFQMEVKTCAKSDKDAMTVERQKVRDMSIYTGVKSDLYYGTRVIERLPIGNVLAPSQDRLPFNDDGKYVEPVVGLVHPQVFDREEIQKALKARRQIIPKPFTTCLTYVYDFGDNWHIFVYGSLGCSDLIEEKVITEAELERAMKKAKTGKPVMLAMDGEMLIEDAGNVEGMVNFFQTVQIREDAVIKPYGNYSEKALASFCEHDEDDEEWEMDREDENGMLPTELLEWAISQGWHRKDKTLYSML